MELEEAIKHARDVGIKMACSKNTKECGKEHLQLAAWLEELLQFRKAYGASPKQNANL